MNKYLTVVLIGLMLVNCNTQVKRVLESETVFQEDLTFYKNDLFTGVVYTVYDNDELKSEYNAKDGKEDGLHRGWWEDGKLFKEINYKDGVQIN